MALMILLLKIKNVLLRPNFWLNIHKSSDNQNKNLGCLESNHRLFAGRSSHHFFTDGCKKDFLNCRIVLPSSVSKNYKNNSVKALFIV